MTDYDAVLFDNDGVLVEPPSDEALRSAAESAFRAVGVENPTADHDAGIVSSNQHATVEFVLDFYEFGDRFDTHYGRGMGVEDLRRKKPDSHFLDRALADLGAETALLVGDSESDVEAAERAGLDSAFVRRDPCEGVELSAEPDYEVADLWGVVEIAGE